MLYLKRHNLRGGLYEGVISGAERRRGYRSVGVTFDDGYEDFLSAAVPTLESLVSPPRSM